MAYRIAMTGASGQLGTTILRDLLKDEDLTEVRAIDLAPPRIDDPRVHFHRKDVRESGFEELFEGCDAVFHLAFVVVTYLPRQEYDAINVGGSKNVFEAAAKARVPYVLYTSSIAAYGVLPDHPNPMDENTPLRYQPDFPYAAAKYEVESFLDEFEPRNPGMKITRLRPVIVIGPNGAGVGNNTWARKHVWISPYSHGIALVWDGDVAQGALLAFRKRAHGAFLLAADDPLPGPKLAAAAGWHCVQTHPRLFGKLVQAFTRIAPRRKLSVDPSWLIHDVELHPTSRKAREELGWKPECPTCVDVLKRYAQEVPSEAGPAERVMFRALDVANRVFLRS